MRKMKFTWLIVILTMATLLLAGCFNKEEKQAIQIDDEAALLGSTTVLISEVYYDTTGDDNIEEYVELYNMSSSSISVGGWTLTDNAGTYTIPSGTSIPAKSAITVARNTSGFYALFGKNPNVSGMTLSFGNTGDKLTLKNGSTTIDFVAWESYVSGWAISASTSKSIARTSVASDSDTASDWTSNATPTPGTVSGGTTTGSMKVHFIDVGQGDCILVQAPSGQTMLIDAGSYQPEIEAKVLSYLRGLGLTRIDVVVATHPHSDHIGSLDAVINNFTIGKAYDSGYAYSSVSYTDYINALNSKSVPLYSARRGQSFYLASDVKVEILSPTATIVSAPANVNDVSVVLRVVYKNTSFMLTGDAPQFVETEIRTGGYTVNSDVLKVGHHGSYSSTAPTFVDAVTPTKGAVILVGEGNPYGHPHTETMTTLNSRSIPIYRTDLDGAMNGNIVMISNGTTITKQ